MAQIAQKFSGVPITTIFCSPLIRARESADIINKIVKRDIQIVEDIKERHYGVLGGLTKDEAKERYPEAVTRHGDLTYTHSEDESYPDFYARVVTAFEAIVKTLGAEPVIILSHGGAIKCILKHLGQPLPGRWDNSDGWGYTGR